MKPRDVSVSTRVRDRRTGSGWPKALHKLCGLEPLKDTLHKDTCGVSPTVLPCVLARNGVSAIPPRLWPAAPSTILL